MAQELLLRLCFTSVKGVLLFSLSTLAELEEVLWRNKFDRYISYEERKQFLTGLILQSTPIEINETISECRDPKDNKFLELAVCGKANFIISGDEDLLVQTISEIFR